MGDKGLSFSLGTGPKRAVPGKLSFGLKPAARAKPAAIFQADSSDDDAEEAAAQDDSKRQRTAATAPTGPAAPPADPDVRKVVEKLAEFVAKNGRTFEEVTRQRNPADGPFRFLFNKDSPEYAYYEHRVAEAEAAAKANAPGTQGYGRAPGGGLPGYGGGLGVQQAYGGALPQPGSLPAYSQQQQAADPPAPFHGAPAGAARGSSASIGTSAPPLPAADMPAADTTAREGGDGGKRAPAPVNTVLAARERPEGSRATAALADGDSLAAMEAFAALAARHEQGRPAREEKVELLNETSFDRRRQVAVYKNDGKRGHHMQDYIPPEELAVMLASGGGDASRAQAEALEAAQRIGEDNIGHRMLRGMGWREGEGLGASASGIAAPLAAGAAKAAQDKIGLGAAAHGAVQEDDDEFEAYRKRMMLGYKHRPNPLGNPRKQYY
ncbi:hypothetical protein WJX81_004124 [Elliptochloris bilobata]|uniref:SURP and G-patch domain-containing protein 1-like protein n=1 Tax=Elliptochloris bilobata TaxID=381761 RepID=A0AAW1SIT3_9CHLO